METRLRGGTPHHDIEKDAPRPVRPGSEPNLPVEPARPKPDDQRIGEPGNQPIEK
jgi:hypothetical protein